MTDTPSTPRVTDTPVVPVKAPPVSRLDIAKAFIGDLARPFAIIATSYAAARAIIIVAGKAGDLTEGAIYITAVLAGVGAIYGLKSWENAKAGRQAADVAIAAQTGTAPPPESKT